MYKVRNNMTQEEYWLLGKALVQQDTYSGLSAEHRPLLEYTHGVLLYSIRDSLPIVVPYSLFEEEFLSEDTDMEIPVWDILEVQGDIESSVGKVLPILSEAEAVYHREWSEELRFGLPCLVNALYRKIVGNESSDEAFVRLLNASYDTSFGTDDPKILYATLDEDGVILQPAFMPTRKFIQQYRRVK